MAVSEDLSRLSRSARWRKKNPHKVRAYQKAHTQEREVTRIRRTYGLSLPEWEAMLISQSGRCNICRRQLERKNEPCVGHPHYSNWSSLSDEEKKKSLRGMLCFRCNSAIGLLKDDVTILEAAIKHLRGEVTWQLQ